MRIARLQLENWEPFKGTHVLELRPQAYAVFARYEDDPDRSNWAGKSSLLGAVRFALTGDHDHRLEDEWISNGEERGAVTLVLDDGTVIDRSRKRGKATQFVVGKAKGDDAQALLWKAMGLAKEDWLATCWWEQGATSRLVTADPAERTRIVTGWLELGPLQAAEGHNARRLGEVVAKVERLEIDARGWEAVEAEQLGGQSVDVLANALTTAEGQLEKARAERQVARARVDEQGAAAARREKAAEYARLVEDGVRLKAELAEEDKPALVAERDNARATHDAAVGKLTTTSREAEQRRKVALGEFDGKCPVAGIACPAKDAINADVKTNRKRSQAADAARDQAREEALAATNTLDAAEGELQAHDRKAERLKLLRDQALKLQPAAEASASDPEPDPKAGEKLAAAERKEHEWVERVGALGERVRRIMDARRMRAEALAKIVVLDGELAALREAALVLGKNGAQRDVARGALEDIEQGANERVRAAGVDLEVRVRWEHESKMLAKACGACGWPFPESTKVKECPRCKAERGPHYVNRLEFERSRKSGGADDMMGVALQLAGSAWLRDARGSAWATGLLDEPTSQMDAANRRALAQMLRAEKGFEQLLVVSHHHGTLDALPGRILITSDGTWARAEVAA